MSNELGDKCKWTPHMTLTRDEGKESIIVFPSERKREADLVRLSYSVFLQGCTKYSVQQAAAGVPVANKAR